jgi:hypothetical protein
VRTFISFYYQSINLHTERSGATPLTKTSMKISYRKINWKDKEAGTGLEPAP